MQTILSTDQPDCCHAGISIQVPVYKGAVGHKLTTVKKIQSDDVHISFFLLPLIGSSAPRSLSMALKKILLGKHLIIAVISVIIVDLLLYISIFFSNYR